MVIEKWSLDEELPPDFRRPMVELMIYRADDGYIATNGDRVEVVDEDRRLSDINSEVKLTYKLMWMILDLLELTGSKHDAHRVRIIIESRDGKEVDPNAI